MNSAKIVSFDVTFLILSFFIAAKKRAPQFCGARYIFGDFCYFLMLLSSSP